MVSVKSFSKLNGTHRVHMVITATRHSIRLFSVFFNHIQRRNFSTDIGQKHHLIIVTGVLFFSSRNQFRNSSRQFILDTDIVHSFQFSFGQFDFRSHGFGDVDGDHVAEVRFSGQFVVHRGYRVESNWVDVKKNLKKLLLTPAIPTETSDARGGVFVSNQAVDGLGEVVALLAEGLHQFIHTQATGVGFHSLDVLELESNLVDLGLDGGLRGDLHHGYTLD